MPNFDIFEQYNPSIGVNYFIEEQKDYYRRGRPPLKSNFNSKEEAEEWLKNYLEEESLFKSAKDDVDNLVCNLGHVVEKLQKHEYITEDDWDEMIRVNLKGLYNSTKSVVDTMINQKAGKIINISSIWGQIGASCEVHYSTAKAGIIGFTKALALELAQDNITVNTIHPGWVETELAQNAVEQSDFSYQEELEMIPQRRFIHPDEIGELVRYLVSNEAKGLTGQNINLCAGLSVG